MTLEELEESRGQFVLKMRANPNVFGISAWYRDEDWDKDGNLIAVGEARARAIDPWANDRAAGRKCPPLPSVNAPESLTQKSSVNGKKGESVNAPARSDMAGYMRDARKAKKLGITVAEYRAQLKVK